MSHGTCRCQMCGVKNSKTNRNSLYRYIGCDENREHGKYKVQTRRRLRRSLLNLNSSKYIFN